MPSSHSQALAATLNEEPGIDVVHFTTTNNVDRYAVLREFARGGLGRILEATDRTLGRKVAIKELRVGGSANRARFLREAMVTARLQHPSIVPLYDMGRWASGDPYYAMKLVAGRPLDQVIAAAETLDERLALVPNVIAVADAIAYAHSQRIIHRDLKPQNVIVGDFGETVVIDWGLAKDLDRDGDDALDHPYRAADLMAPLTCVGEVVGTPLYMAPEQASGDVLDERADVYSIGAILYELLTGERPHRGASSAQVIARLINGEAVTPVEECQPAVPPELATIVRKAMTFERDGRYHSAHELAADLRRFQTGQLVAAHRYSRATLASRWVRKHRHAVAVAATLLAVLAVTVIAGVRGIVAERDATRAERDRLILVQARGELERDPTAAVAWLKTYPATGTDRGEARAIALDAEARGVARHVLRRDLYAFAGQASPDGTKFVQLETTGLRVIDLATGATVVAVPLHLRLADWAPDSASLVAMDNSTPRRMVRVDLAGRVTPLRGTAVRIRDSHASPFGRDSATALVPTSDFGLRRHRADGSGEDVWTPFPVVSFARHDELLASVAEDGRLWWWQVGARDGRALQPPAGVTLVTDSDALAFLGNIAVAAGTTDGRVCVWALADGAVRVLDGDGASIRELQASDDGRVLVSVSKDGAPRVWDLVAGTSRGLALDGVVDLRLTNDGRRMIVAHRDHTIEIVGVADGRHVHVAMQPTPILAVAVSADGRWVQTEDNTTTRLFRVPAETSERVMAHSSAIFSAAISGDGATLVTGGMDQMAMVWAGGDVRVLAGHRQTVTAVAMTDDTIISAGDDGTVRAWDRRRGTELVTLAAHDGGALEMSLLSHDAVVTTGRTGSIRVWDLAARTTRELAVVTGSDAIEVSPDRQLATTVDAEGALHVMPVSGGAGWLVPGFGAKSATAVYSPDGRTVVGGDERGRVVEWNVAARTSRVLATLREHVRRVRFSPDGRWLVATDTTGTVHVWDRATGAARRIAAAPCEILDMAFIGGTLATTAGDAAVRSFDPSTGALQAVIHLDAQAALLRASGDGRYLLATTDSRDRGYVYRIAATALAPHDTRLDAMTGFSL